MRIITIISICAVFLVSGCTSAGLYTSYGLPNRAAAATDSVSTHPGDAALARELAVIRSQTRATRAAVAVGGVGMIVAGISGYRTVPDGSADKYGPPWISLAVAGAAAVLIAVDAP